MTDRISASFGKWLREHRKALALTQAELGKRVGYSEETIRKIETGRRRPSRKLARLLAKSLGQRPSEFNALVHHLSTLSRSDTNCQDLSDL